MKAGQKKMVSHKFFFLSHRLNTEFEHEGMTTAYANRELQ